jgi:hypothetical protein
VQLSELSALNSVPFLSPGFPTQVHGRYCSALVVQQAYHSYWTVDMLKLHSTVLAQSGVHWVLCIMHPRLRSTQLAIRHLCT